MHPVKMEMGQLYGAFGMFFLGHSSFLILGT